MNEELLKIRDVVAKAIDRNPQTIGLTDNLPEKHNVDSLLGLEILVALEKHLKVKIPESMMVEMTSVEKIAEYVRTYSAAETAVVS